ncbi:tryptophan--tRNA ligase, cytoplasmic [Tanacetum coccineum]
MEYAKESVTEEQKKGEEEEQVVTPWEVASKGKIDYDKLIVEFGCQRLDQSLLDRVFKLTNRQPHVFLRRNVFFAHRCICFVFVDKDLIGFKVFMDLNFHYQGDD